MSTPYDVVQEDLSNFELRFSVHDIWRWSVRIPSSKRTNAVVFVNLEV